MSGDAAIGELILDSVQALARRGARRLRHPRSAAPGGYQGKLRGAPFHLDLEIEDREQAAG